ncbi:hypothetical protein Tco_1409548 [Tanacetum coccineum]
MLETSPTLESYRIFLVILPEHPSETIGFHNEDGNPARANIKQALDILKLEDGMEILGGGIKTSIQGLHLLVKASATSDVTYSFTSAQDGNVLQDDVRLCLGNDIKKDQICQRQAQDDSKDSYHKCTRDQVPTS